MYPHEIETRRLYVNMVRDFSEGEKAMKKTRMFNHKGANLWFNSIFRQCIIDFRRMSHNSLRPVLCGRVMTHGVL